MTFVKFFYKLVVVKFRTLNNESSNNLRTTNFSRIFKYRKRGVTLARLAPLFLYLFYLNLFKAEYE